MVKNRVRSNRWTIARLVTACCLVVGCDDLTRFKQERYECGYNPDGLVAIDFRDFKKGAETTVTFIDRTVTMPVVESNDESLVLNNPGLIIRIDRKTGIIRLTNGTRYRNVKCAKSNFQM